jgi:hypothetical protein
MYISAYYVIFRKYISLINSDDVHFNDVITETEILNSPQSNTRENAGRKGNEYSQ